MFKNAILIVLALVLVFVSLSVVNSWNQVEKTESTTYIQEVISVHPVTGCTKTAIVKRDNTTHEILSVVSFLPVCE